MTVLMIWARRLAWMLALRLLRWALGGAGLNPESASVMLASGRRLSVRLGCDAAPEGDRVYAVGQALERLGAVAGLTELPCSQGHFEFGGTWGPLTVFTMLTPAPVDVAR